MSRDFIQESDLPNQFPCRVGDVVFEGRNNSLIVMGTDRMHHGVATVSDGLGHSDAPGGGKKAGAMMYIIGRVDRAGNPNFSDDSSYMYMSMRSNVDESLKTDDVNGSADPTACLVLKSDSLRAISRKDLKIVLQKDGKSFGWIHLDQNLIELNLGSTSLNIEDGTITVNSGKIKLGEKADHKMILGDVFKEEFLNHIHQCAVGPTSTPNPASIPKTVADLILSEKSFTE